jgi:hypothetical protein
MPLIVRSVRAHARSSAGNRSKRQPLQLAEAGYGLRLSQTISARPAVNTASSDWRWLRAKASRQPTDFLVQAPS